MTQIHRFLVITYSVILCNDCWFAETKTRLLLALLEIFAQFGSTQIRNTAVSLSTVDLTLLFIDESYHQLDLIVHWWVVSLTWPYYSLIVNSLMNHICKWYRGKNDGKESSGYFLVVMYTTVLFCIKMICIIICECRLCICEKS